VSGVRDMQSDAGFTLVELMVTVMIGTVVLFALFGLVDVALHSQQRVDGRVDSNSRGRLAMEQMVQDLRSSVCVQNGTSSYLSPIASADANQVTFYTAIAKASQITDPSTGAGLDPTTNFKPDMRQLTYSNGTITENTWTGQGTVPTMTFPSLTRTKSVINRVQPDTVGAPIFTYWTYDDTDSDVNTPPVLTKHTGTIAAADLPRIVQVDIDFTVNPTNGPASSQTQVDFSDSVLLRVQANPNDKSIATQGPQCKI
jgi:prepilin-type N-terminal cleavage/methylation domain-containing protein